MQYVHIADIKEPFYTRDHYDLTNRKKMCEFTAVLSIKLWIIWKVNMRKKLISEQASSMKIINTSLRECIPPPIWKFLAPPKRKSMGQSGSLMIFCIQTMTPD